MGIRGGSAGLSGALRGLKRFQGTYRESKGRSRGFQRRFIGIQGVSGDLRNTSRGFQRVSGSTDRSQRRLKTSEGVEGSSKWP